ncbi:hypothetical protein BZA05DRAFT_16094 [Tricharina praecox]|uniref:uncharacterized protein n=1 Tax=Tricharina praecox TaxID=43433 RepID=UPI002220C1A7|nr:uncharacterized protein BZA05DRAFT_16094 [Tricharina praecox]KAI5858872.1 hypothetical protein BZA05DRAFT_16094 [Tricharina praecox]
MCLYIGSNDRHTHSRYLVYRLRIKPDSFQVSMLNITTPALSVHRLQRRPPALCHSRLRGATVARQIPDLKAACSNHVGVIHLFAISWVKLTAFVFVEASILATTYMGGHSVWRPRAVLTQCVLLPVTLSLLLSTVLLLSFPSWLLRIVSDLG